MSEPVVETVEVNPPAQQSEGISEEELEGIVGRVVDARLVPLQESIAAIQPLDVDTLRFGILEDITNLFSSQSGGIDEGKLTQSISSLLDSKLKGIGSTTTVTRKAGPLSRYLGFG